MSQRVLDSVQFTNIAEQILGHGSKLRFQAKGSSMLPSIKGGDVLLFTPFRGETLRCGNVILYINVGQHLVAHRIVKCIQEGAAQFVQTQGDNLPLPDQPVPIDAVLGMLVGLERNGHYTNATGLKWRLTSWIWNHLRPARRLFWLIVSVGRQLWMAAITRRK